MTCPHFRHQLTRSLFASVKIVKRIIERSTLSWRIGANRACRSEISWHRGEPEERRWMGCPMESPGSLPTPCSPSVRPTDLPLTRAAPSRANAKAARQLPRLTIQLGRSELQLP